MQMAPTRNPKSSTKTPSSKPTKKAVHSSVGAPSQHNQASRKGKRAWRKNVDIDDVEEGLEGLRAEERVTGTFLQKKKDEELFQIDVKGDDQIRNTLPRFSPSQLTSTKILSQRSAVPAVFSRSTADRKRKRGAVLSREDKSRLLRIAKRGGYDPWVVEVERGQEEVKDGLETVMKKKIRAPALTHPRDVIEVPAITQPHQGTSYNPPVDAHRELLLVAHETEERRIREEIKLKEVKAKIDSARREAGGADEGVAPGMKVDEEPFNVEQGEGAGEAQDKDTKVPKKLPERKTKQQRNKAARILAEKRSLAERAAKKRMAATINDVKALRRAASQALSAQEKARAQRRLALQEKLKKGLQGQKLGKHRVPQGDVDVQLGEELSDSLRGLKPEGNLFRDRFLSLQQRALIEPRVPVLPKKRRNRVIEYEKHAWKRFE